MAAGLVASPMLDRWPVEYTVDVEPPTKRAKLANLFDYPVQVGRLGEQYGNQSIYRPRPDIYDVGANAPSVCVPTPPSSSPPLCSSWRSQELQQAEQAKQELAAYLETPIRTREGSGPTASQFCGAVSFLWFGSWPVVQACLSGRKRVHSSCAPKARPEFVKYTRCLIEKADVSAEILTLALLLLHRFREKQAARRRAVPMDRHPTSEARAVVVALMTANKFLDDVSYTTSTWSKMSGIALDELKRMETEFLVGLDFNLHVRPQQWAEWVQLVPCVLYPTVGGVAWQTASASMGRTLPIYLTIND